ncbi:MAG: aspartate 1-decarboxylase [Candidatus Dadabacteria bacterium]|nr:MAG: aspartate 1-decarboxylase [Candidatus Dadabacteria bacterium]
MRHTMLKSKIHRAVVTGADLHYQGSITIDRDLMDAANMVEYEKVAILDIENGNRFETYVIEGARGSGVICLNGAAARLVQPGDHVIILSYVEVEATPEELADWDPSLVFVDENNRILDQARPALEAVAS